jgi:hypothetical protein
MALDLALDGSAHCRISRAASHRLRRPRARRAPCRGPRGAKRSEILHSAAEA